MFGVFMSLLCCFGIYVDFGVVDCFMDALFSWFILGCLEIRIISILFMT